MTGRSRAPRSVSILAGFGSQGTISGRCHRERGSVSILAGFGSQGTLTRTSSPPKAVSILAGFGSQGTHLVLLRESLAGFQFSPDSGVKGLFPQQRGQSEREICFNSRRIRESRDRCRTATRSRPQCFNSRRIRESRDQVAPHQLASTLFQFSPDSGVKGRARALCPQPRWSFNSRRIRESRDNCPRLHPGTISSFQFSPDSGVKGLAVPRAAELPDVSILAGFGSQGTGRAQEGRQEG
ncbi:unnamed protein product [Tuwongella immobilis]|uniref:Uncharacterized protein n=1 Tax=Tuwongella immobilis TaxID=692036 RepID=A0A6C2YRP3_9BACT|nr:unnamed protein product [Tuwongella immobilis]VTS05375.1 unnamed protein product [Tuwongella immobilis]